MRLRAGLYFPLDVCCFRVSADSLKSAVWFDRLPCFNLRSCGCFRAVFILAFFPCTHDLWGPCMRPVAFLVQGHSANWKSTSGNALTLAKACMPSFPPVTAKISCEWKRSRRASGGLNSFLTSLCCLLQSRSGWIGQGRERDRYSVSAVSRRLLSPLVWMSLWIEKLGLSPSF